MNILTLEGAIRGAEADVTEWQKKFEAQWYAPVGRMMLGMSLSMMPMDVAARMKPETLNEVAKLVRGKGV